MITPASFISSSAASISILLRFIIISGTLFAHSGVLPSTAYGGTTWVNNMDSLNLLTAETDVTGALTVRPILLTNNISYNDANLRFGCGFFCYGSPCGTGYLFATFFIIYKPDNTDPVDLQLVWTANREQLVHDNATLELTSTGNLVLKDAGGNLVWSTNTSTQAFKGMEIRESGNLVLLNSSNETIWQSFDHPTDNVLLGQKWKVGQKAIANISPTNTSPGNFYGSLLAHTFAMFTASIPPHMYFMYPEQPTTLSLAYMQFDKESIYYYAEGSPSIQIAVNLSIPKNCLYLKIDSNGHLQFYSFQRKTGKSISDYLTGYTEALTTCDYPTTCGNYGICSDDQCSCPKSGNAFEQIDESNPNFGCLPHSPLVCSKTPTNSSIPHGQHFLELEHVSYFTYRWENASIPELVSPNYCKTLCSKNCSCKAAFFRYGITGNTYSGHCYLESNVYSLQMNSNTKDMFYNSTAYIKVLSKPKRVKSSVIAISVAVISGAVVLFLLLWAWITKSRKAAQERENDEDDPMDFPAGLPLRFAFQELQNATNDFSTKLGGGGFGSVYEGSLSDGTEIAVKRLDRAGQGTKEFRAEVETLGNIHHINLVRLKGFCAEKSHRMLVYEYLPNGSLDRWIFSNENHVLDWKTRSKIVHDIARGLAYLHEECRERIIHFDIKPQNILVDENFNAKISDFGLAKLINRDQSELITMMRGTPGYMAPELLQMQFTEKADIYSFGVMVVEIVSGKRSREVSAPGYGLLSVLQRKAEEGKLIDLVDSELNDEAMVAKEEAVKMLEVGMCCIEYDCTRRPAMSTVVKALEDITELRLRCVPSAVSGSSPVSGQPLLYPPEFNNRGLSYAPTPSVLSGPR